MELKENWPEALFGRGVALLELDRPEEALACYQRVLSLREDFPEIRYSTARLLLSLGEYEQGWSFFESRKQPYVSPYPKWQGQSLSGKSIVVLPEQGMGDLIQFCRFVAPAVHYWTPILSIPLHAGITVETIPAPIPYLFAPSERLNDWIPRVACTQKLRVRVVWRGNPGHPWDKSRSLPSIAVLSPLWQCGRENIVFYSLQKGAGAVEARCPPVGQPLVDLGAEVADFADMAAVISLLDLVISVDTAVAHLAGAMGKACWVILPEHRNTDWRWLRERSDSPWYPDTVRLFRRRRGEMWAAVVERVARSLAALITPRDSSQYDRV